MRLLLLFSFILNLGSRLVAQDIFDAARKGDTLTLGHLISINRDTVNSRNAAGFTPLILATYHHQAFAVNYLLRSGAKVNLSSPEGPALLAACFKPNLNLVVTLLKAGADVNAANPDGVSALMFAVMSNDLAVAESLVNAGASVNQKDKHGRTARDYCSPVTDPGIRKALTR